jgi:type IV pilus assembly protein PilX
MNTGIAFHMSRTQRQLNDRQGGVVLVILLVILLLMTLIGVTSMQTTTLDERMAGNTRQRNLAFQSAEAGLRSGENLLQGTSVPAFGSTPGLLDPWIDVTSDPAYSTTLDVTSYWMAYDWTTTSSQTASKWTDAESNEYTGSLDSHLSEQPRYVIEHLYDKPSGGSLDAMHPGAPESWYRVTSRGVGGTANAVVILQSIYRR